MMIEEPNLEQNENFDQEEEKINHNKEDIQFCPYLGLKFDPKSWVGYPSPLNYCHRVKPLAVPKFEHQINHCLSTNFIDCPVVYGGPGQRMPKAIQSPSDHRARLIKIIRIEVIIGLILITVILGAIFWGPISAGISQIGLGFTNNRQTSTQPIPLASSPTNTITVTSMPTLTATLQPSPTQTHTPLPPSGTPLPPTQTMEPPTLALETPIGQNTRFIIHAVIPGESLELYARDYNTTVEAIRAINYNLPSFLPLDWIVVIPLDTNDVTDIPPFEPYEVKEPILVEALAELLSVDLTDLRIYNRIPRDYTLNPEEWIIVPRETTNP